MARRYAVAPIVAALALSPLGSVSASGEAETADQVVFDYTGDIVYWTVPDGVYSVDVDACGGAGADRAAPVFPFSDALGGRGGRALATIEVSPGEELAIAVGGSGDSGGWNGGGSGGSSGGGASDVRQSGDTLADRVVVGGGGGGAGYTVSQAVIDGNRGGAGGGAVGGGSFGGDQNGPGVVPGAPETAGDLGVGGDGIFTGDGFGGLGGTGGGGGGGLYGGAGGDASEQPFIGFSMGAGSGGSGLGDSFETGACVGDGRVVLTIVTEPSILPGGVLVDDEGDAGSTVWLLPVVLSHPSASPVSVDWEVADLVGPGLVQTGSDVAAASGTVTFAPGETEQFVPLEILGDTDIEAPLLWGEWGVVDFSNPVNASIDTSRFFGAGLFIILDDE